MINAYVLGQVIPESEQETISKIRAITGVQEAHLVFGKFDLVAKLSAENATALNSIVLEKIRQLPNLIMTQTLLVSK